MKNERTIQKGNVKEGSFDVRIIESDGKTYYYHFLELVDGQQAIESQKPINLKGVEDILWDNLPFTVKEAHCKKIYPNYNLNDYETRCLLYGKQQTDEEIVVKKKREEERENFLHKVVFEDEVCVYSMAATIYDNVGPWDSIQVIYERNGKGKFCVDGKIITIEHRKIISIEDKAVYDAERKAWGRRISQIAKSAGTTFDIATVVGKITDTDIAIETLKEIVGKLNSDEFELYMKRSFYYSKYNTDNRILIDGIRNFLFCELSPYASPYLNMSNKFCNAVKEILNNK